MTLHRFKFYKTMIVYVVTNLESGWDCVRGVYTEYRAAAQRCLGEEVDITNLTDKELEEIIDGSMNIIHEKTLN